MGLTTIAMDISASRLYLAGLVEDNIGWIKIRNIVKLLENDIFNISEKWQDFVILTPLIMSGSVAFMGSFSKDNKVPDETFTRPFPSVDEKKLDDLYEMCNRFNLQLNPNKTWKGVSEDPSTYSIEVNEGIQHWLKISDLYLQLQDILYMLRARKFYCCNFSNYENLTLTSSRTPGQITQTFPNTVSILIRTPNQPVRLKRLRNKLSSEYLAWLYRDELTYIQHDPEYQLNIRVVEFNQYIMAPEYAEIPPSGNDPVNMYFRFPVHLQPDCDENDLLMGFNSIVAAYTKKIVNPLQPFEKQFESYELNTQSLNTHQLTDPITDPPFEDPAFQVYDIIWDDDFFSDVTIKLVPNDRDENPVPAELNYAVEPEEFQNQGIVLKMEPYNG